jgi:hypothetical protein
MYGSDNNSPDSGFEPFSFKDIALAILIVAVLGWTTTSRSSESTEMVDESPPEEIITNPYRTDEERDQAISDEVATLDKEEHELKCDKPNHIIYSSYDEAQEAADKDSDNNCTVESK